MARRPFWHFDGFAWNDPDAVRELWRKRLERRRWLPRAVANARRIVRAEYQLGAERLRRPLRIRNARPIRKDTRQVVIVTTAAPPWLTGTSVNPLCRATALARRGLSVTLLFPWLEPTNQVEIFAKGMRFATRAEQEKWIRANFDCTDVEILFYRARFHPTFRSILPTRSVTSFVPPSELLILEEPEHLLAPHPWQKLKEKSSHIVGIVHTHYLYLMSLYLGRRVMSVAEPPIRAALPRVVRRNCHQTICLSKTITGYSGAIYENVNGVREEFFEHLSDPTPIDDPTPGYFMGKLIWEKGFRDLIDLLSKAGECVLDVYGDGENRDEILAYAEENRVVLTMRGLSVRPYEDLLPYRVFVNPSTSEVLCTTTAEALAMGKWAIIPKHPSNEFFLRFPNCLAYTDADEFVTFLQRALHENPPTGARDALTWDAATERFLRLLRR